MNMKGYGIWSESEGRFIAGPYPSRKAARYVWRELIHRGDSPGNLTIFPMEAR